MTPRRIPVLVLGLGALLALVGPLLRWIGPNAPDGCVGFQCYSTIRGTGDRALSRAPHTVGWGISPLLAVLAVLLAVAAIVLARRVLDETDPPTALVAPLVAGGVGLAVAIVLLAEHRAGPEILVRQGRGLTGTDVAVGAWLTAGGAALVALAAAVVPLFVARYDVERPEPAPRDPDPA